MERYSDKEIRTVEITYVRSEEKVSKGGKKYTSVSLKTKEYGENEWINGFGNAATANWKVGDKVQVFIFQEEYNGRVSTKFKTASKEDLLEIRIGKLENYIKVLVKDLQKRGVFADKGADPDAMDAAFAREADKAKASEEAEKKRKDEELKKLVEQSKAAVDDFDNIGPGDLPTFG